jgi:CBS domain-containing protein
MDDPAQLGAVFDPNTVAEHAFMQELQRARRSIDGAADAAGLQRAAGEIQALVQGAVEQAPAEPLTRLISTVNDRLTRRVIELTCAGTRVESVRWCWIALGSEGRQEQTLSSDQDNGIIFADSGPDDALREMLLPLAWRINEALASCGFPLCAGQIMASNPQWCLSLHEWRNRFANWIIEGEPQALLNATIFFDLRPLYGARDLAQALADWLAENASDNPRFLFQMTENALRRAVPLGVLRGFTVEKSGEFAGTIDLKLNAGHAVRRRGAHLRPVVREPRQQYGGSTQAGRRSAAAGPERCGTVDTRVSFYPDAASQKSASLLRTRRPHAQPYQSKPARCG